MRAARLACRWATDDCKLDLRLLYFWTVPGKFNLQFNLQLKNRKQMKIKLTITANPATSKTCRAHLINSNACKDHEFETQHKNCKQNEIRHRKATEYKTIRTCFQIIVSSHSNAFDVTDHEFITLGYKQLPATMLLDLTKLYMKITNEMKQSAG